MTEQPPTTLPVRLGAIPQALRECPQWVNWKWDYRKGKPTKVPLNPRTGYQAASTKPWQWATFRHAVAQIGANGVAGIGFMFSKQAGIVGVDLDKCRENGVIADWATAIIRSFASYSELSPTGAGVHVFVYGVLIVNRKTPAIEVYDQERFFTVTGHRLAGLPREPIAAQTALDALVASLGPAHTASVPVWQAHPVGDPRDLRSQAASGRIRRDTLSLLDSTGPAHYPSASEADAALAAGLASAGLTANEIAALLMDSIRWMDMMARKGKHAPDYLRRTIEHACAYVGPVFEVAGRRARYVDPVHAAELRMRHAN